MGTFIAREAADSVTCEECGKEFRAVNERTAALQRFCSKRCRHAWYTAAPLWVVCAGPGCDNQVKVHKRGIKGGRRKFCSDKCRERYWNLRKSLKRGVSSLPVRTCATEHCERRFMPKGRHHIYCEPKCAGRSFKRRRQEQRMTTRQCEAEDCSNEWTGTDHRKRFCSHRCCERIRERRKRQ